MPTITTPQRQAIQAIVGPERARFDVRERRVYSHDTGVLPAPFRLLAGPSLADGVVQFDQSNSSPSSRVDISVFTAHGRSALKVVPSGRSSGTIALANIGDGDVRSILG